VNNSAAVARVKVSADGHGVVSHAGVGSLQAMAGPTGLSAQVTGRTGGRVSGPWTYASGAVFADLAAAVAGEADCERLPPHRSFRLYVIPYTRRLASRSSVGRGTCAEMPCCINVRVVRRATRTYSSQRDRIFSDGAQIDNAAIVWRSRW
jgi:hypothetical protein